ncbi:ribonuclease H-like domain-containing protein [Tanacetum coccineum]|uniref:Ribonuclease H-like domain-containing protein n=1 Tax=Tanacetum coccineum TaxID=301880 RepID=A0ABQ5IT48_9ASTR
MKYLSGLVAVKYIRDPIILMYKVSLTGLPARSGPRLFGGTLFLVWTVVAYMVKGGGLFLPNLESGAAIYKEKKKEGRGSGIVGLIGKSLGLLSVAMFVHNSVHDYVHYSDDDEADPNPAVTLISKLDLSHPLHLHPNDSYTLTFVSIKLKGTKNYNVWSRAMLLALEGRHKTGFIDNTCRRSHTDKVLGRQCDRVNDVLRSNILSRDPLPDAKGAYVLISSEESHRAIVIGSGAGPNNVPTPNNNGNRRATSGPTLVFEHCGFNGHTIDRCFKLIGYPGDFGKKNNTSNTNQNNQNFNRRFMNNNISVGSSFTSALSDEQISKLLSLIKENSLNDNGKGVQANMTGANQHLTYTNKNLVNVIDISYLRIKVSHPNGTKALITKVGNLVLNNFLTIYDVLVAPEYRVTLVSVHKVARDNKFIVGFDESKCFFMSQDLKDVKIMSIGKQVGGLYYSDSIRGALQGVLAS